MADENKNNQEKPKKPNLLKKFVMGLANILTLGLAGKIRKHLLENKDSLKNLSDDEALKAEKNYIASQCASASSGQETQKSQVSQVSSEELKEAQESKQSEESSKEETEKTEEVSKKDNDKKQEETNEEEKQM